ncbi:unnamed protein product [Closterium sp. NIES-53]
MIASHNTMDAEMASWKSTGTYVDEVPPPRAYIVSGMWIFRVKLPPGSPPAFKARYVARGFSQRRGVDFFQTFSPTPKMTTLRLRRPPGFTGSFPAGTQWSLRRPVYGLRQAPREWHDTPRTTLAALGFAPSIADPSLFLRTDATLPPFYVLVYVDDLVFATADTEALAHVKSELQKRHTCTDLGELTSYLGLRITRDRAQCTITLSQSHMVQQVLQRFGLTYSSPQSTPLPTGHSLSAPPSDESVEPSALGTDVLDDRQEEFECLAAVVPHLMSMLLAPEGDPDAPDIPTPRSYAEAIEGPNSSQWQAAMDAEMASWKSTGTYVDEVPPPGANIVNSMWIFRGVDFFQTFSPTPKMTTLRVLLHVAVQRDYELLLLDFSTAFLKGSLHEEIWLRRPPGFTGSFPAGTQWSLRRPVYGLRQAPREWHDTLRTTLATLGFSPSTADPSLFLRFATTLPRFYVLVYITRDRAQCTITLTQSHMVLQVLQHFSFTYSSPQSTPLPTGHSLLAPPSDESVEPSGPTSGMGLVLGGRARVVLTGHADASWVDDLATQRSSSCEAEIYTGAMAAQELRWLTYLLTDFGEAPRSPPVLYINKAMLALCQEHRLEHRTKHIALCYFLARELQQRGQLRLAYVASQANTADVFTKAL